MIISDYREEAIPGVESISLTLGDFLIKDNETGDVKYIIERKSITDLSASIRDGRFREQRTRLLSSFSPDKIIYIIEKSKKSSTFLLPRQTLLHALINLSLVHSISVINTESFAETTSVLHYLDTTDFSEKKVESQQTKTQYVQVKKCEQNMENALSFQLRTIPGVSPLIADTIQKEYIDTFTMISRMISEPDELCNLKISEKRKVGVALSKKIKIALGI